MADAHGSIEHTSLTLLHRATVGDQEAWSQIVDLYSPLVYARCLKSSLNPNDANDVRQEVFTKVFQGLNTFAADGNAQSFRRWLLTVTRNAIVDYVRRNQRQPEASGGTSMQQQMQQLPEMLDDNTDLTGLDSRMKILIRRAIQVLRRDYEAVTWKAFWMTAIEGQSPCDVADELGLTSGAVRQAKYKILKRLREELGQQE